MAYNQPKNTPMHGVAMHQRRDGGSMYKSNKGPNMYDNTGAHMGEAAADLEYNPTDDIAGPQMVDTYDSKGGASEPISAAIITAKVLAKKLAVKGAAVAKKAAASKMAKAAASSAASSAAGNLATRATSKKEEEVPGPDAVPHGTSTVNNSSGGYATGGAQMGPSKGIDFGKVFSAIGDKAKSIDFKAAASKIGDKLQRKPKAVPAYDAPQLQHGVSKLEMAGRKVKSTTGMLKNMAAASKPVTAIKKLASTELGKTAIQSATTSAAANLASRLTSGKDDEAEDTQVAYNPGGGMGGYSGGGYAYGGSMIPKMASQDSSYIDKRQGDKKAVMEGLMNKQLPISVGNFQFDFRNVVRMKELANRTKELLKPDTSRSSSPNPISPSSVVPTKISAYTAKQDSTIKSLGSYQ